MKPLLVLLLVLGAIAALLFAITNLSKNKPEPSIVQPAQVENNPGPTVPVQLDPTKNTKRETAPVTNPALTANGGAGNMQFENRLTGIVKNVGGNPVVGAEVTLSTFVQDEMFFFPEDIKKIDPEKEPKVRTNAEGRYTFLGIEPRKSYSLLIKHPEYATKREPTTPIGETGTLEQPPITLFAGASLSGYVRDEGSNLVPDALLVLDPSMFDGMGITPPDRLTTRSDNQGWYSFVNVPPGEHTVTVTAAGYGKLMVPRLSFLKDEQIQRDFTLKIAEMICGQVIGDDGKGIPKATVLAIGVSSTQQTSRDQVLTDDLGNFCFESLTKGEYNVIATCKGWRSVQRNHKVSTGTSNHVISLMREARVCGLVIDSASGKPMTNFRVRVRIWTGEGSPTSPLSAQDDSLDVMNPQGEFCIEGVPPGDFLVEATAPGYAPTYSPHFTVQQGQPVNGVTIKLSRGGSISGRVVDAEGKPIARARIVTHDNTWVDDAFTQAIFDQYPTNTTSVDVRSDEAGRFVCTNLNPDLYQIVVSADGFMQVARDGLRVTENGNVQIGDIKLGRGGSVRGTLYDASGKPITGGTIQLQSKETPTSYTTRTGGDGKFSLPNCVPGRYSLSGMQSAGAGANPFEQIQGMTDSAVDVIVAEGDVTSQDLRLRQ